jgi:RNA polymerase sigma factor for flagellar operon FliA
MRYVIEEIYLAGRTVKELAAELGSTHAAVSQQRAEAIRLMRDGLAAHYADEPGTAFVPESRINAKRRHDYMSQMGSATVGGITRPVVSA